MNDASVKRCASQLLGLWCVHAPQFLALAQRAKEMLPGILGASGVVPVGGCADATPAPLFKNAGGTAVIHISGVMTKHDHSFTEAFGGTSTVRVKKAIRAALADPSIDSIMLVVDSPGGTVAGTSDLAHEVREADLIKPVFGHAQDTAASAAYWVLSQTRRVTADDTTRLGSIGVFTEVVDSSGALEKEGIRVHVVKAGEHKGDFTPGTKVTDDQISELQREVDSTNAVFIDAVARGRGLNGDRLSKVTDGRVHIASDALGLGLIDGVQRLDAALDSARQETQQMNDPIGQFEKDQPAQVSAWKSEGVDKAKEEGAAQGRAAAIAEAKAMASAFGDRPSFALEQFVKGHSLDQARADLSGVLKGELEAEKQKTAALTAAAEKAASQKAQGLDPAELSLGAGEDGGEADSPESGKPQEPVSGSPPEAVRQYATDLAGWEWKNDKAIRDRFAAMGRTEEDYKANRRAELSGRSRVMTRATS